MFFETNSGIEAWVKGNHIIVAKDHKNYSAILKALKSQDEEEAYKLATVKGSIDFTKSIKLDEDTGTLTYKGNKVFNGLRNVILKTHEEEGDLKPFEKFLDKLYKNPSATSVRELYDFLVPNGASELPLTPDGCFMAYKAVDKDFKDIYTHKIDNSVGTIVNVERNEVDDDRTNECSFGLHAGRYDYAKSYGNIGYGYGNKMIAVKIDPSDVVSVPKDYNGAKLRTCKYEVIFEVVDGDVLRDRKIFKAEEMARLAAKAAEHKEQSEADELMVKYLMDVEGLTEDEAKNEVAKASKE